MAAENHTTQSAQIVAAPFGMPRVDIPPDAALDHFGRVVFVLDTVAGPVHVRAYWYEWECRGTAPALIAAGLMRAEWLPGLPGNKKTRQQILFDSTGPRLPVGRTSGKKQTQPHITVCRLSSRTFVVKVQATPEQYKQLDIFHEKRRVRNEATREKQWWAEYKKGERQLTRSQKDLRDESIWMLSAFNRFLSSIQDDGGFRYAEDVMAEVNQHVETLKQTLLLGKILPAALQYQRDGNVVYFPWRGLR